MSEEKKLTGYPSIDKPQNKFYRNIPLREIDVEQTIYELVFNSNKDNMDCPAIEYLGVEWSFAELKNKVDRAADAFYNSGLRCGDVVLMGVSNCPEVIVCLLGLNKIGAVSKWFDVRASEKDIQEYANESHCRYLVAFDMLLPKIERILKDTELEKVLILSPVDSLSKIKQIGYSLKNKITYPNNEKYIRFADFVKLGNPNSNIPCVKFDKGRPSIMIQSSGTTGKPKVIVHSDYSATAFTKSLSYFDMPLGKGKKILNALPPWIAYALGQAIICPLSLGSKVILCPTFDSDVIMSYIGKFTISFGAPFHYRYLVEHFGEISIRKKRSFFDIVDGLVSGGDKISVEENYYFEKILKTVLVNGYGNNEGWGGLAINPTKANKYGSVGIPKYGETLIIYDNDREKEVTYGELGEICVLSNTMFLYYEGNQYETETVKRKHPDGNIWLHTGDLGIIDEDGFVFLQGRLRRVIVRKGFKISAYTIEDKICEYPDVKECVAVEVKDDDEEHVPMAYVVLRNDYDGMEQEARDGILNKCRAELKEYEIPKYIQIIKALPYTQNGKYNFRLLEQEGNKIVENLK